MLIDMSQKSATIVIKGVLSTINLNSIKKNQHLFRTISSSILGQSEQSFAYLTVVFILT
ncbi:hypothetical protein NIES4102_30560 [Chondrocystis sp. NIES-4102]|nr:hypothetical protein NIES4102_30560 [Chondrocystis sp. NIES-4102]